MTPRLQVQGLHLHGVGPLTFQVAANECVGLTGPSGCGKTLVLRAIADMEFHRGQITLDGESQGAVFAPTWRRRVALLPAQSEWWFDRVGDHFSQPDADNFRRLGLDPDILTWPVARLSSGERQRLALLRLLANRPEVLLLDEPTANLDADNVERMERLIEAFCTRTAAAVLWVGHQRSQLARVADRILDLADGQFTCAEEGA